jgi:hypothetical protein
MKDKGAVWALVITAFLTPILMAFSFRIGLQEGTRTERRLKNAPVEHEVFIVPCGDKVPMWTWGEESYLQAGKK